MTKKDYKLIAESVKETHHLSGAAALNALERLANRLADKLAVENSRFDRTRFLAACGF